MNNPFDYIPDHACREAFGRLLVRLKALKGSPRPEDIGFCRELEAGKMLGVLIAADASGERHTLYAFSGQLGSGGFHHAGFVEPVFDYLQPDGYFKTEEANISRQNREIFRYEEEILSREKETYARTEARLAAAIGEFKEKCRLSKLERHARRAAGSADKEAETAMLRQSQFEKAELRRLKNKAKVELQPFADAVAKAEARLGAMKERRRKDSASLQQWLFSNFQLMNARGESRSLSEIFSETPAGVPPSGAGECCAPKLLQAAYRRGWKPLSMAEYWYGKPKDGEVRIHGRHYPACRGKCLPVLSWMLQGLELDSPLDSDPSSGMTFTPEILYCNEWFCVVDKPSGMLSVPGKGKSVSVQQWLAQRLGAGRFVKMAHRLDQDTSGLLVAALDPLAYKTLQSLFATRQVSKTYVADLVGDYEGRGLSAQGRVDLPLSADWMDRPRQRVDFNEGKPASTEYSFLEVRNGRSRVMFTPLTGRTHQLRVHAASEQGLGMPIAGDRLYGDREEGSGYRLRLHAHKIEFTFPLDGCHYCFESPVPFS